MSSFSTVNTAFASLQAAQAGMMVTSQNVAGAKVEGYSRRRAEVTITQFAPNASAASSTGFSMEGFVRDYSQIVDAQRVSQSGDVKMSQTLVDATSTIDGLLLDKSTSLGPALDSFYSTGSALVRNPADNAARATFIGAAASLVSRMQGMSQSVDAIGSYATVDLGTTLAAANRNASDLANLNKSIVASGGSPSADLLDQRDNLLKGLHSALGGQSSINPDGTAVFRVGGYGLVDSVVANTLAADDASNLTMTVGSGAQSFTQAVEAASVKGGTAGADLLLIHSFVPTLRAKLDTIATDLAKGASGLKADGSGTALFSYDSQSASSTLRLVVTDAKDLQIDATGAGRLPALQMASSKQWAEFVSVTASTVGTWNNDLTANTAVQGQLQTEKERISGVNLDEEAANLLTFQQLYQASSKIMEASSKMFDSLLGSLN